MADDGQQMAVVLTALRQRPTADGGGADEQRWGRQTEVGPSGVADGRRCGRRTTVVQTAGKAADSRRWTVETADRRRWGRRRTADGDVADGDGAYGNGQTGYGQVTADGWRGRRGEHLHGGSEWCGVRGAAIF